MSDHVNKTVEMLKGQIQEETEQTYQKKKMVNSLLELEGLPSIYQDIDSTAGECSLSFRSDRFYLQPLATAVRDILEARRASNLGSASIDEIYETLVAGGFKFTNTRDAINKRTLSISLAKNSVTFHKLPNGEFGLLEWYPGAKDTKSKNGNGDKDNSSAEPEDEQISSDNEHTEESNSKDQATETESTAMKPR